MKNIEIILQKIGNCKLQYKKTIQEQKKTIENLLNCSKGRHVKTIYQKTTDEDNWMNQINRVACEFCIGYGEEEEVFSMISCYRF